MSRAALWLAAALALPGCALLGKSTPVSPRFYAPDEAAARGPAPARTGLVLRLGRVAGWSHLRERMVLRTAGHEVVFDESHRWTERPEVYLRRALERALFEDRGVVEVRSGASATLEVELVAFEEVEAPHRARLQARVTLRDPPASLLEETVLVEQPIGPAGEAGRTRATVAALSTALDAAVSGIADRVVAALAAAPAAPPAAPPP